MNHALNRLNLVTIKEKPIFKCDVKSENELFVTLTYPDELNKNDIINIGAETLGADHLSLVAIKNGMHDSKGYQFILNGEGSDLLVSSGEHVSEIGKRIVEYFEARGASI